MKKVAACTVAGVAVTGMLRTNCTCVASAETNAGFITYNGNSSGSGSKDNPAPVWKGWAGPGKYYLFAASRLETSMPVNSVQELNQYNVELFGCNLSGPYGLLRRSMNAQAQPPVKVTSVDSSQEQRPTLPMMALPEVSSKKQPFLSQTELNGLVFAGELAAFYGLLWTIKKIKEM